MGREMRPASSYEVTLPWCRTAAGGAVERPTGHSEGTSTSVRRMDGSGRSEAPPATTHSVFTADGNVALSGVGPTESLGATTLALDGMCLLMENPIEEAFAKLKALC